MFCRFLTILGAGCRKKKSVLLPFAPGIEHALHAATAVDWIKPVTHFAQRRSGGCFVLRPGAGRGSGWSSVAALQACPCIETGS